MKKSLCLILTMFFFVGTSINAQNDVLQELINNMVLVEGGSFRMGAQNSTPPSYNWQGIQTIESYNYDSDAQIDESPVHKVTLNTFYICKYEVPQELWEYVMAFSGTTVKGDVLHSISDPWLGVNPSSKYGVGADYPVYNVSWNDIVNIFLPRLNSITGLKFRLPTEAEWEYAARGGKKSKGYIYSGSNIIDDVAWYYGNAYSSSNYGTHPVGTKAPNELGLYDMSGNVSEWCSDWKGCYSSSAQSNPTGPTRGSYRVYRGGSWGNSAQRCRVSFRDNDGPAGRNGIRGLRLVSSSL